MAEFGTRPPESVTVPSVVPLPLHATFVKNVYVTVPVGVKPAVPVTAAVSYALAPVVSVPTQAAFVAASKTVVVKDEGGKATTVIGSHALVAPL